ncbi:MAG: hypothetical protein ACRDNF_20590, partial [Streptosporangiaceae bacterium]
TGTAPETASAPDAGRAPGTVSVAGPTATTVLGVLRTERVLQIALLVTVVANLGSGGMDGVALPSLAHGPLHAGADGFGSLIAAFGAGALLGTLVSAHLGRLRRPAIAGSLAFLIQAVFMALVPYLGGTLGAGGALVVLGAMNGFGNVVMITAFQRWAPPALLGRLSGVLMLASFGVYPISVVLSAFLVHGLGPAPFFPMAGAALGVAVLAGLSQRTWRDFGITEPAGTDGFSTDPVSTGPVPSATQPQALRPGGVTSSAGATAPSR